MAKISHYEASIKEIHHTQKLDSPSGTAITLAEGIIEHTDKKDWTTDVTNSGKNIPIISKRIPEVPGTHKITYTSTVDTIEIKHTAHNRHGFALGAIIAAEWLIDKKGVYTMKDVLGI
jgi:4-hydroxy-tetrahydrodipicolinate reductase